MEQATQFRIEGLEEALASFASLNRAIEKVTESSRLASEALAGIVPTDALTLPLGEGLGSFGNTGSILPISEGLSQALSATLIPELQTLDEQIANALSAVLLPDLKGVSGAISEASSSIQQATTALNDAVGAMTKAIEGFKLPPLQVVGLSPEQLYTQLGAFDTSQAPLSGLAADIGEVAISVGSNLIWKNPIIGSSLVLGGLGLKVATGALEDNDFYGYDEEALERMNLVRGFPDIATLEDGWILSKVDQADSQRRGFLAQVEFFSAKLKELDEKANADVTPLLDEPAELFEREQARALRDQYSKYLLELLDRAKLAGGIGAEGFDADALALARRSAEQSVDQITPALSAPTSTQLLTFEPIKIDIKVLSDHRLSIRTDNPNSNVDLSLDFYCGPNMVGR